MLKGWLIHPILGKSLPAENTAQSNISRGVTVGIISMTASFTEKFMTVTIGLFSMTANITTLACASWLNFYNLKAVSLRLVGRKLLKLISGPFMQVFALLFSQFSPVTDSFKFFNRNRWIAGLSGKLDNLFGDNVHTVFGKPGLLSALPFHNPPNRTGVLLCLLPLEACTGLLVTAANMIEPFTTKKLCTLAVGDYCNVIDAPINADDGAVRFWGVGNGFGKGDRQIDLPFFDEQAPITQLPIVKIILQFKRGLIGYPLDPTVNRRDTQPILPKAKIAAPLTTLQNNCRVFKLDRFGWGLFELAKGKVFGRNLPVGTDEDLRRKVELCFQVLISQLVKLGRIANLAVIKRNLTGIITNIIPFLDSALGKAAIKLDFEFNCSSNVHELIVPGFSWKSKLREEGKALPPPT